MHPGKGGPHHSGSKGGSQEEAGGDEAGGADEGEGRSGWPPSRAQVGPGEADVTASRPQHLARVVI